MPMTGLTIDELRRRHLRICVLGYSCHLVPLKSPVEPDPQPAAMAHVGRDEETLWIRLDKHALHPFGRGAPECEPPVAVVVGHHHHEGSLVAHEEGRRPVTQALAGLR